MMDKPNRDRNRSKKTSWEKNDSFSKSMRKNRVVEDEDDWKSEIRNAVNSNTPEDPRN